ncbi:MAG TPA: hypothetical protein VK599_07090 [Streptosporangiaceae bacterium]|nr:hypothetical protein [Streptosporangiaceae bacterium]
MTRPENERIGPVEARWQTRGAKGDPGSQGERGERGPVRLAPGLSRALVFLFLLPTLIAIAVAAGLVVQARDQQATQARQGRITEQKLCATFGQLAALRPPPGNPAANPSRAYLQAEHATLVRLGTDLGCKGARP